VVEWLSNLTDLMIFYTIAIVATLVLLVQLAMMLLGADHDVDADVDVDIHDFDHPSGLNLFSLRSVTGFFGGFGWAGVVALESGLSMLAAGVIGTVVGGILMLSVAYIMRVLYSLRESGTLDFKNALGEVGTVYLPIPPNQSGPGQIRVMIQGRLKVIPAYTEVGEKIPSGRKVKVLALLDPRTVLVEPLGRDAGDKKEGEETP
jgi:hypothetical protein